VREAAVIAVADERGEKRLVAYVVPEQEALAVSELRQFLQQQLPEYMVPSAFVMLAELPLSTTGKVDRRALPSPAALERNIGEFVAPRDSVELQLAQIWEDILGRSPIGIRTSFFDLGGHSLLAVRLMWMIEERFGQKLELSVLFQGPTIEQLAKVLSGEQAAPSSSVLVNLQPEGTGEPLFCVHPGGGEVMCYYRLAQHLGRQRPFYGLQAPSLSEVGEGEDNYTTIEGRAAAYLEALRSVQPTGPYFLAGWSFGGVVAFEMAQQLQRAGERVGLLALLDTVAPVIATDLDEGESGKLLAALAREHASKTGRPFALSAAELMELEPEEQLRYVLEKMKAAEVVAVDIREEIALPWMQRMLKGYRSRGRAYQAYTPQVYDGQITLFKANINPGHLQDGAMKEITELFLDPTYCWAALSTEPIRIEQVTGYHEILLAEPHVQTLAARLQACLEETEAD
jgi:thioesterase domain-containing protein/acyl carrier protein